MKEESYRICNSKCTRWNEKEERWEKYYCIEELSNIDKISIIGFIFIMSLTLSLIIYLSVTLYGIELKGTIYYLFVLFFVLLCTIVTVHISNKYQWIVNKDIKFKTKEGALRYIKGLN